MNIALRTVYALIVVLFFGCATIINGGKQSVTVNVLGNSGADVFISELAEDSETILTTGKSGLSFEFKTGKGYFKKAKYKVKAKQDGKKVERILEPKMNLLYYLGANLLVAGPLTGMVGYLIVDPLTGAMWNFDLEEKNQLNLDFEKDSVVDSDLCKSFNQTVTLKNQEVIRNVVMGIIPNYIVVFTREGKSWVYPKSEVKGAENSDLSQEVGTPAGTCDIFSQSIELKKGQLIEDVFVAITSEFVVVLKKEGKVVVYPKAEVQTIQNK